MRTDRSHRPSLPPPFWRSGRYFRLLVKNAQEHAIFSLDLAGHVTTWNPGAERLLGWSEADIVGRPGALIFTEEDRAAGVPEQEMTRAAAEGRAEDTRWHVRRSGARFWANGVMEAVRDEDGTLVGFAKILRDLTREKEYKQALEQSNQRLQAFASQVAHELRSPLTGIRTLLQLVQKRTANTLDDKTLAMARHIDEAIDDLDRFASDLLAFARLDGCADFKKEPVASAAALEDALADLATLIAERDANVRVGPLPDVHANPSLLRHLFRNLISNAIEHNDTEQQPRVKVSAEPIDGSWHFYVEDNGPGVAPSSQGELFSLFQTNGTAGPSGLGVGLALCKRIVEHHRGHIWVEVLPGRGSRFCFTLPKHPDAA